MTVAAGTRLGVYEILSPLGAGGMGEVWRARDTRLGREVAIKILPPSLSADADRLRRFEKEARAASSLNHPAIVTIYEIGKENSVTYLAMELVDGATLRDLLAEGPLPVRRMLGIGAQIADGLAKAHGTGIVHRDLKPENVMVSRDGFAKILDFGLAKLAAPEAGSGQETKSPTVSAGTEPGVVMGTVGYMSPEQARGAALDFRSDQFALGSVLYEMATGKRAFPGETKPEILAAIIRDEPQPIAGLNPRLPAPLRWIIDRCLSKDPRERYASTEDLARDLRSAETHLSEISTGIAVDESRERGPAASRWKKAFGITAWLLAGAAVATIGWRLAAGRSTRQSEVPSFRRVTFQRGNILHARFAPDGQTILYAASWEGRPTEIFSTRVDGTESRPLGMARSDLAAVSGSGELLILLKNSDFTTPAGISTLARVPLAGGAPREIAQGVHAAEWLRGGAIVVQHHLAADHDALETPVGKRRLEYSGSAPRVSADGRLIAIARETTEGGDLTVLDDEGKILWSVKTAAEFLAWHPGGEIWFTRVVGQDPGLFAASRGASVRPVLKAHGWVLHDIAPDGRLLMERGVARNSIRLRAGTETKERELSWLDGSTLAGMSADAGAVLFSEGNEAGSRAGGVYRRATDGSPAVRLADGEALAFSEDGRWALVRGAGNLPYAFVPTGAGQSLPLDLAGEHVVSAAFLPGTEPRVVATVGVSPDRGRVEIITPAGRRSTGISPGFTKGDVAISPDGSAIAYGAAFSTGPREVALCRLEKPPCRKLSLPAEATPVQWSGDGRFLYLRDWGQIPAHVTRYDISSGAQISWLTLGPEDAASIISIGRILLSRDGRTYAFDSAHVEDSSLFLVEGLR
ncbi:MAG TPA: protein kinase [Thermoanaerobaculia bacterium]|nr:protein kinase [Thermoanaerobaculia bacterium]